MSNTETTEPDLPTTLVCAIAPALIRKTIQYMRDGKSPTTDEIVAEIMRECADDTKQPSGMRVYAHLRDELEWVISELKHDIIDEVSRELKDSIKTELHMELFTAFENFRVTTLAQKGAAKSTGPKPPGTFGEFEIDDSECGITDMKSGHDSIKHLTTFAPKRVEDSADDAAVPASLANNPLFASISKRVDNVKQGKSAYSAEEYVEARKDRLDSEHAELIITGASTMAQSKAGTRPGQVIVEDVSAKDVFANDSDDDIWEKMLAQKYGTH